MTELERLKKEIEKLDQEVAEAEYDYRQRYIDIGEKIVALAKYKLGDRVKTLYGTGVIKSVQSGCSGVQVAGLWYTVSHGSQNIFSYEIPEDEITLIE